MAEGLEVRARQETPLPLDADLACGPGEILALVGPSGAGKSSLLRVIAGLLRPQEGVVRCGGQTWFDSEAGICLPARKRRVGFVFQHHALFPHLTALENVMEALEGADRALRARRWLERVHLGGLEARRPWQMSGGQQQRVGVARALAREPQVLLLDEPFSSVDRVTREKLHLELAGLLQGLSIPVVLVTHDLDEATMLAHRMVVLARGRSLQDGMPEAVVQRPSSPEVARLLGHRNILHGTVRSVGETLVLDWGGLAVEALPRTGLEPGQACTWVVAPNDVRLRPLDEPRERPRHTYLEGRVAALVRQGDLVRAILTIAPGRTLHVTASWHLADRGRLALGADVVVALSADRIQVYDTVFPA